MLNDEQVREVIAGENGLARFAKPGTVIAIHSTISDTTAVELARQLQPDGIHVIDAPISGGKGAAEKGELAVMVGAEREVYERIKPAFKQFASLVVHAGEPGAGTRMKLARNMLTFIGYAASCEAMKLADQAGLSLQQLGRVVRHTDLQSGGRALSSSGRTWPRWSPTTSSTARWRTPATSVRRISALRLHWVRTVGVDLPLAELALKNLAAGLGVPHSASTTKE